MVEVPVWEKYTLSIDEAAAYFRIGENKLRKIIHLTMFPMPLTACSSVTVYRISGFMN